MMNLSQKDKVNGLVLDLALILTAYFGAFLLRDDFYLSEQTIGAMAESLPWIIGTTYAVFVATKFNRDLRRYASFVDALRFAQSVLLAGVLLEIVSLIHPLGLSNSIVILFTLLLFNLSLFVSLALNFQSQDKSVSSSVDGSVLIVGAGELAEAAVRYRFSCSGRARSLVGFVDDDKFKLGKLVRGFPVLGKIRDLNRLYALRPFGHLIIATSLSTEQAELVREFLECHNLTAQTFSIVLDEVERPTPTTSGGRRTTDQMITKATWF